MAVRRRRRTASGRFVSGGGAAAPIVVYQEPQRRVTRRRRSRRRASTKSTEVDLTRNAIAGAVYGLVERVADDMDIPEIPMLGRKGTIALALYLGRDYHPMVAEAARAGIIIAGYELVSEGKITGE